MAPLERRLLDAVDCWDDVVGIAVGDTVPTPEVALVVLAPDDVVDVVDAGSPIPTLSDAANDSGNELKSPSCQKIWI